MNPTLRTAASGMAAQQTRTEVIANNLANVNTTAFKRSRAHFEDLLYQTVQSSAVLGGADATTTPAIQVGRGTRLAAVERLDAQGALQMTGSPLDVAIEGDGLFQVQMPNGTTAYTRDGSFQISDQGTLTTKGGHTVVPGIKIPDDVSDLSISRNGIVSALRGGDTIELGRIELARFPNSSGLLNLGENLYSETTASGRAIVGFPDEEGMGRLIQGHLEGSNVEIVQEMVEMISAQRAYELNSKAIKAADEMSEVANQIVR
ncbi:MAG TPA: flagellar basal-body rod protein FlgG [Gemmatimonadaceae bacterium]|nr:flagellar basal-body rod protein FlgG [Gemmatimonadaceae bacterium]